MLLRKSMFLGAVAAVSAFLSGTGSANALKVFTDPVTLATGPAQTNFTDVLTFDQFDPADYDGALLESVHIDLLGQAYAGPGTITCFVPGANGRCNGSLSAEVTVSLFAPGNVFLGAVIPTTGLSYNLASGEVLSYAQLFDEESLTLWFDLDDPTYTGPNEAAIIASFEGSGTIDITVDAQGEVVFTNTNGFAGGQVPLLGFGQASISYDYSVREEVPEPLTILGTVTAGLMGVAMKRRQRKDV